MNNGSLDAMISFIEKTPDLTENQKKYINYIIEYENNEQIIKNQLVKQQEFVRIRVRVEYKKDISVDELPTETDNLSLGFKINYVQSEETGVEVVDNGRAKIAVTNGSLDEVGTIVTIGSEQFYTIGTEGDNVKLISMYNLYVGNIVDEEDNVIPIENPTGMQSSLARGDVLLVDDYPHIGTIAFSSTGYKGDKRNDYNGSIVERYVNDYKTLLENRFGINILEARLFTYEEANNNTFSCVVGVGCSEKYPWIYYTSYWLETPDGERYNYFINTRNAFNVWESYDDVSFGVRPVIVLKKNDIVVSKKQLIKFNIESISYHAEEGMTWGEWIESVYNINSFYFDEDGYVRTDNDFNLTPCVTSSDVMDFERGYNVDGGSCGK